LEPTDSQTDLARNTTALSEKAVVDFMTYYELLYKVLNPVQGRVRRGVILDALKNFSLVEQLRIQLGTSYGSLPLTSLNRPGIIIPT